MRLFIDSAQIDEIEQAKKWGMLDGVTTNPSLIKNAVDMLKKKKQNVDIEGYIIQILKVVKGKPVSLEVVGSDFAEMVKEGKLLFKKFNHVARNVYVKIPVNPCIDVECNRDADGIRAIAALSEAGIPVNCTLIFTPEQALLAAKAGAKIVSPFVGREDDYIKEINHMKFKKEEYFTFQDVKKMRSDNGITSGVDLVVKCKSLFIVQKVKGCEILAASIRDVRHFREVALAGADIATMPLSVMQKILEHPKTKEGMRQFIRDIIPEYAKVTGFSLHDKS